MSLHVAPPGHEELCSKRAHAQTALETRISGNRDHAAINQGPRINQRVSFHSRVCEVETYENGFNCFRTRCIVHSPFTTLQ